MYAQTSHRCFSEGDALKRLKEYDLLFTPFEQGLFKLASEVYFDASVKCMKCDFQWEVRLSAPESTSEHLDKHLGFESTKNLVAVICSSLVTAFCVAQSVLH
jgi:hypothetical protein